MMYVNTWINWFITFLMVVAVLGCGESDLLRVDEHGDCYCSQLEKESMALVSATCAIFFTELEGTWDGLGERENTRFESHKNGYFVFWVKKRNQWWRQYDGFLGIDFHISEGMYKTVLHIPVPDNENYSVLYRVVDDVIYFEEPSDFEANMRYGKVSLE